MVFQNYALWPHMTVFDNVAYGLRLRRVPAAEITRRVREALALVEIGDVEATARRKPAALSGGQQQRVALARAIVVEPRVLLLDEPLSNLDAKIRQRLRVEVRRLQRRVGITTIYVTHDQEEALAIADRVVLMNRGERGRRRARRRRSISSPATEFVADFLGVGNRLEARAEAGRAASGGPAPALRRRRCAGPVLVILRSSDLGLAGAAGGRRPALAGTLEESLFLGAYYRHYVRVGDGRAHGGRARPGARPAPSPSPSRRIACACTRRPDPEETPPCCSDPCSPLLLALVVPASAATRLNVAIGADVNVVEVHKTLLGPGFQRDRARRRPQRGRHRHRRAGQPRDLHQDQGAGRRRPQAVGPRRGAREHGGGLADGEGGAAPPLRARR